MPSILTIWLLHLVCKLHTASQGLSRICGRHGLDKGFLKIRSVLVEFIREKALPAAPHPSDSGVLGGPVVAEVHDRHYVAQSVFNYLPFPFTVYHTDTDLEFTLTSGDKHSSSFGQNRNLRQHALAANTNTPATWLLKLAPDLSTVTTGAGVLNCYGNIAAGTRRVLVLHRIRGVYQDARLGYDTNSRLQTADGSHLCRPIEQSNLHHVLGVKLIIALEVEGGLFQPLTCECVQFHQPAVPTKATRIRIRNQRGEDDTTIPQERT